MNNFILAHHCVTSRVLRNFTGGLKSPSDWQAEAAAARLTKISPLICEGVARQLGQIRDDYPRQVPGR